MKQRIAVVSLAVAMVLTIACGGKNYEVRPGALDSTDSQMYDALLFAWGAISQAREEAQKSDSVISRSVVNRAGAAYNASRSAWLARRAAIRAGRATDAEAAEQDFARFQAELDSAVNEIITVLLGRRDQ